MNIGELVGVTAAGCATGTAVWLLSDRVLTAWLGAALLRGKVYLQSLRRQEGGGGVWARLRLRVQPNAVGGRFGLDGVRDRRTRAVERARYVDELPDLIDIVALGLSAGISFDAALETYCARCSTSLSVLMGEAMNSWRLGMATRSEALHGVANRLGIGAFTTFVETVTESLDYGAPLVDVLAEQAEAVRRDRRLTLEEQVEKAPVKMLVPTGTLVLPAMLLAILGPLLASLSQIGAGGA